MRGLHLVLLAALLCSDRALSLRCYLCAGARTPAECSVMSCGPGENVCYKGEVVITSQDGQKVSLKQGRCAPSCELISKVMQAFLPSGSGTSPLEKILEDEGLPTPKFELQNESCCDKDLCNGVSQAGRSLWALAGGLLLSLGPALLWALL